MERSATNAGPKSTRHGRSQGAHHSRLCRVWRRLSWRPTNLQADSLARCREPYDLIRAIEDRASLAFARIASVWAFRKSRNVRNTTEVSPRDHATIRSRCRSGSKRTNCTPLDRRLLMEAGTMATPSSASTNERIVCIEFGSFSTRGEKP
jgi:hypothetical protein